APYKVPEKAFKISGTPEKPAFWRVFSFWRSVGFRQNLMDTSRKLPRFSRAIVRPPRPILHQQACTQISDELGHGRLDVVSAYNDDQARAKHSTWSCSWRIFSPGRMPFANVTYAKQRPFKRRSLIACTKIIHGPGSESISHGF
ncbi:hypothetical protein, partial [Pseudomonas carnis]|uniref:hypothetical protein n=1 Tax=Pseudomonas carnis TaxID=2487355 RepID=UPI002FCD9FD3